MGNSVRVSSFLKFLEVNLAMGIRRKNKRMKCRPGYGQEMFYIIQLLEINHRSRTKDMQSIILCLHIEFTYIKLLAVLIITFQAY